MAAITLSTARTICRQRAEIVNSQFVTDSELTSYVNLAAAELYDLLVAAYDDWYVADPVTGTIASGSTIDVSSVPIAQLRLFELQLDGAHYRKINRFKLADIDSIAAFSYRLMGGKIYISPADVAAGQSYRYWYTPQFVPMVLDADTFQGVDGWEEYVYLRTVITILAKKESDTAVHERMLKMMKDRIAAIATNRDAGDPECIGEQPITSLPGWIQNMFPWC